jgi:hypothetical protein
MTSIVLLSLAAVAVIFVVIVALQPSRFRVARSRFIEAPASIVFGKVNDLREFQTWSPFAKIDPQAQTKYEGPMAGAGAAFSWAGNHKAGEGTMLITKSQRDELVRFRLDFRKPFAATNTAEFVFEPQGDQTTVTWSMTGRSSFFFKALKLFMNCDKMVGREFEKGLNTLKTMCESSAGKMVASH